MALSSQEELPLLTWLLRSLFKSFRRAFKVVSPPSSLGWFLSSGRGYTDPRYSLLSARSWAIFEWYSSILEFHRSKGGGLEYSQPYGGPGFLRWAGLSISCNAPRLLAPTLLRISGVCLPSYSPLNIPLELPGVSRLHWPLALVYLNGVLVQKLTFQRSASGSGLRLLFPWCPCPSGIFPHDPWSGAKSPRGRSSPLFVAFWLLLALPWITSLLFGFADS